MSGYICKQPFYTLMLMFQISLLSSVASTGKFLLQLLKSFTNNDSLSLG